MTVISGSSLTDNTSTHSMDHSISLSNELGQLFDTATNCDLNILLQSPTGNRQEDDLPEMDGTTICAHKTILSLFPNFNVFPETTNITVELRKPCHPYFSSLIRYLYTRKIDVTFSSALCLHQMASSFGIKQLMEDVGRLFTQVLPDDSTFYTQVSIYQYAVETNDKLLEENLLQYLAWNYQNLTSSPAWDNLPVKLLQALLTRSDLVVPDEYFVLETLESWIMQRALLNNSDTVVGLLSRIRFPMIPAEKLLELESRSPLYKIYENVYREFALKAFQFNVLLFSDLLTNPNIKNESGNYSPRIYTVLPWSKVLRESSKTSSYQYQRPYNRYDRYLYTRKIDVTFSSALCLHQMAASFGVKQLVEDRRLFTQVLPDDSSFYTHMPIYQYAVETNDTALEENLLQYLAWNYQNLTSSPAWDDLPVELLQALLTRSDLVVPDEYFVLETVESWIIQRALLNSSDTVVGLLSHIRFPMIPAEKLLELESRSPLYKIYENVYREFALKAFQFNVLLFSDLLTNPSIKNESGNYSPRIYTALPWSKVLRESSKTSSYPYQRPYNRYDSARRTGLSISEITDLLGFSPKPSQGFTKNGPKKEKKHPFSGSYVSENALLMPEVKGEGPDWF
ncbi:Galectin-3-binding protein B [Oryzias melastigma]|uniref:Galectin-3-binding protein B n=1 Tax=Oryzias melastigma TaxID=30732 RepID=A0A834CQA8_ORYME|nr:Galectin-3-binding protein B [Oryzias melastigma]